MNLEPMRSEEIMNRSVERVRGSEPIHEAAARMRDRDIGFLPVVDDEGVVVGTLTDRDIVLRVVAEGGDLAGPVSMCMTREVIACFVGDELAKVQDLMAQYQKSRVIVLDDKGLLAGVISLADLARGRDERATGETVRKRAADTRDDLTAQERQIARLARDGLSNPEIGARLFLSPRTVEYHLAKVFTKLGINSRRELQTALQDLETTGSRR